MFLVDFPSVCSRSWSPRNTRPFAVRCEWMSCVIDLGALVLARLVGGLQCLLVLFPCLTRRTPIFVGRVLFLDIVMLLLANVSSRSFLGRWDLQPVPTGL